jgi:hypothetical protein
VKFTARIKENTLVDLQKSFNPQVHAPKMIGEVDPATLGGANRGLKAQNYVPLSYWHCCSHFISSFIVC